jgi:hypothetical protein
MRGRGEMKNFRRTVEVNILVQLLLHPGLYLARMIHPWPSFTVCVFKLQNDN